MRKNKAAFVGVVCGVLCAACVFAYTQAVRGEADQQRRDALARYGGDQVEVCVAKRDIAAGEVVEASAIETRLWVADLLPAEAVRQASEVVGSKASSVMLAGEVLSKRRFQAEGSQIDVPDGQVALSVPAKDVQAVGGAIGPGSLVDVYATGGSDTQALARGVRVLATSVADGESTGSSSAKVSWVTVAVDADRAEEMVSAAQRTELYFTLPGANAL